MRMKLNNVKRGRIDVPAKVMIYGPPGVGKSSFSANAPAPIFLPTEDGTNNLDVARFPRPETWGDVLAALEELSSADHEYQTLVIDTLDGMEAIVFGEVCARWKADSIEQVGGGYGKGYTAAIDEWRRLLGCIERLRQRKPQMGVILAAHSVIKKFQNPEGDDYDRYIPKMNEKATGVLNEWCDVVLFANYETLTYEKGGKAKGIDNAKRCVYTERRAAYDAKNRFNLPAKMPLDWDEFAAAVRGRNDGDPSAAELLIEELPSELRPKAKEYLSKAGRDATRLAQLCNWMRGKLPQKETTAT